MSSGSFFFLFVLFFLFINSGFKYGLEYFGFKPGFSEIKISFKVFCGKTSLRNSEEELSESCMSGNILTGTYVVRDLSNFEW